MTAPTAVPSTQVQLVEQGWGILQVGWSVNHRPITLAGKAYDTGLGSHTDSTIRLTLPAGATRLSGLAGVDDTPDTREHHNPVVLHGLRRRQGPLARRPAHRARTRRRR